MDIADTELFRRQKEVGNSFFELLLVGLLFASVGAIAWAVRGTSGWSGIEGTFIPGLTWGVLWWYVCWRKGIDARGIVLWLGLGISLGGELGYGQYTGWILGKFSVGEEIKPIGTWVGWLWFAICGIGWAAPGGVLLGWALAGSKSLGVWMARILLPVGMGILTRLVIQHWPWLVLPQWNSGIYEAQADGLVDQSSAMTMQWTMVGIWLACAMLCLFAGYVVKQGCKIDLTLGVCAVVVATGLLLFVGQWLFFPEDQLGLFAEELGGQLGRTVYTQSQNAIVLGWWLGTLLVAWWQRDRFTLIAGLVLGVGFGVLFPISAAWCLGYGTENYVRLVDWWKMWELNSGFFLGPLYVVVLYWAMQQVEEKSAGELPDDSSRLQLWSETLGKAFGLLLMLYVTAREEFLVVGVLLALFYVLSMLATMKSREKIVDRQRAVTFVYAVFLLVFIMAWGMSTQAGILLGLYDTAATSQYAWPTGRILIFAPLGILITAVAMWWMWQVRENPQVGLPRLEAMSLVSARIIDLMAFLGVVGAVSIWPAKIGVFYALFLAVGLFALNRINLYSPVDGWSKN